VYTQSAATILQLQFIINHLSFSFNYLHLPSAITLRN